jgi:hypothetical protein
VNNYDMYVRVHCNVLNGLKSVMCYFCHTNTVGSPVHVAPACVRSGEGSDQIGLMYAAFPCISTRGCFQDFEPMTS